MNIWRPYTQMRTAAPSTALKKAKGAYLYTQDGKKIFDGISSWWLITHGHTHREIAEAIQRQSRLLEQAVFANFTHEAAEELSHLLGCFLPKELDHLFFSDNGSTAVEVAMKMAYQFSAQSGRSEKKKFVAFSNSYHGDTCGAMSVSAESVFTKPYGGMCFEILRSKQGRRQSDSLSIWTTDFEQLMDSRGNEVCAVLIEPLVQGAGGMVVWPIEAIQKVYDIAKRHECLVIFDEVMTGFGRTGTMFAFEQIDRTPDLLCLSKGLTGGFLPLGLTVASNKIYEAFLDTHANKMLFHGHSFTGNALSCAAACANLKLYPRKQLELSFIRDAHEEALSLISKKIPSRETRVCGTIGILELEEENSYNGALSRTIHEKALELDVFIRPLGNIIYLMPPFCSSSSEILEAWDKIGFILADFFSYRCLRGQHSTKKKLPRIRHRK